jgi:glycosyltransferase involved in cell wall biosynthesis
MIGCGSVMSGSEKRRVLFINHWADKLGGAEWSLLDLLEEAAPRTEAFLLCSEEGALLDRARKFGVTCDSIACSTTLGNVRRNGLLVSALREWRGMLSFIRYVFRVRNHVARVRPHLIHANVPKSHLTLFLVRLLGYRGLCCFHMREIFDKKALPYRLYALLFRPRRSLVIAISNAVKVSLPRRMADSARVIHNGVSIAPLRKYPVGQIRAPRFVYLGRVVPWKGCHLLIEAFRQLYSKHGAKAGTLDMIGDTMYWDQSYRDELRALIDKSGIAGVCRLLPHTDRPLEALFRYDVFCIASSKEPFGRVVAEAQGCGLPVIAFDDGGIGEIVEHEKTGLLVQAGNVESFARAMERFIESPAQIATRGRAAYYRAVRFFDISVQREKIVDCFLDAV